MTDTSPTYVNQVKWVGDSPPQLTFIGNSSKSPITIDDIIDGLCKCQEAATKDENEKNFETLYQLIIQRLPMMRPEPLSTSYVPLVNWTWMNDDSYPIEIGDDKFCYVTSIPQTSNAVINLRSYEYENYYSVSRIFNWNEGSSVTMPDSMYRLTNFKLVIRVISTDIEESDLQSFFEDCSIYLMATNGGTGILSDRDINENSLASSSRTQANITSREFSKIEGENNNFQLTINGGFESIKKTPGGTTALYIKFAGSNIFSSGKQINLSSVYSGNRFLVEREILFSVPGNLIPDTFNTYLARINGKPAYTVSDQASYDNFAEVTKQTE